MAGREGRRGAEEGQDLDQGGSAGHDPAEGDRRDEDEGDEKDESGSIGAVRAQNSGRMVPDLMKRLTHAVLVLVAFTLSLTALAADDFYLLRLRVGQEEFRRGQTSEAIEDLKIGCFGLLEQPPLLVEGLAYLALAQAKAGMKAEVDATLIRFAEVEKRFAPFATSGIDTAARLEFTALAKARLSAEVLKGLPCLLYTSDAADE